MTLCVQLISCFQPIQWLSKGDGEDASLREAIDLKHKVQLILDKFERISITYKEPLKKEEEIIPEDTDKTGSKPQAIVTNPEWEIQPPSTVSMFELELDPTTPQAQIAKIRKKIRYDIIFTYKYQCVYVHHHIIVCVCTHCVDYIPTIRNTWHYHSILGHII